MVERKRTLFPQLPPELRNMVYGFASVPGDGQMGTNMGLPLQHKKYRCKHTTVEIYLVHYGNVGLLALQKYGFEEAHEYSTWIQSNGVELRIGILFTGNSETYVSEHWNKKMTTHLRKLIKHWPWLAKVAKYDIQIIWAPRAWVWQQGKKQPAGIANAMVDILTQLQDEGIAQKNGIINAGLHVGNFVDYINRATPLGFARFLRPVPHIVKMQTREVRVLNREQTIPCAQARTLPPSFKHAPALAKEMEIFTTEKGTVEWTLYTKGKLILVEEFRKEME